MILRSKGFLHGHILWSEGFTTPPHFALQPPLRTRSCAPVHPRAQSRVLAVLLRIQGNLLQKRVGLHPVTLPRPVRRALWMAGWTRLPRFRWNFQMLLRSPLLPLHPSSGQLRGTSQCTRSPSSPSTALSARRIWRPWMLVVRIWRPWRVVAPPRSPPRSLISQYRPCCQSQSEDRAALL